MQNRILPAKIFNFCLLGGLLLWSAGVSPVFAAGELNTLFTTPQERQLINANRYKREEVKQQQAVIVEIDDSPRQLQIQEEVIVDYRVSGISLSADGAHTAWVNETAYEDGAQLADGSQVKIYSGNNVRVRITAPDGKHYYATSGETMTVTYMAAVEN